MEIKIITPNFLETRSCQSCQKWIFIKKEKNYQIACYKCFFKSCVDIFYQLPLEKLVEFAKYFSLDIKDYPNKYNLAFMTTKSYIKLLTTTINVLSVLSIYVLTSLTIP